jgi:hypothetical protein
MSERMTPFRTALFAVVPMWLLNTYISSPIVFWGAMIVVGFTMLGFIWESFILMYSVRYYRRDNLLETNNVLRTINYLTNHQADKIVLTQSYLASFIFVQALFFNYWWIIVSVYVYILTKALSVRYLPPFAVILGASGTETNNVVKTVQSAARPLAVRELLQVKAYAFASGEIKIL